MKITQFFIGISFLATISTAHGATDQKIEVRRGEAVEKIQVGKNELSYRNPYLTRRIAIKACNEAEVKRFVAKFDQPATTGLVNIKGLPMPNAILVTKNGHNRNVPPGGKYGRWLSSLDAQVLQLAVSAAYSCQEKK